MRTGPLAGRAAELTLAEVALCRFVYWCTGLIVSEYGSFRITHWNHSYIVVRAGIGAGGTADATVIVYLDDAFERPVDGACRTTDHTDRVLTLHACICDHVVIVNRSVTNESRVIVVSAGAGTHTFVTSRAAIKINHHGGGAIDKSSFDEMLEQRRFD